MNRTHRRQGFTLVEIMIVVLIIGVLMAIAMPNFMRAAENSRRSSCIENMKQLDHAKETWAMANNAANGAAVTMSDLTGIGNYLKGPATGPLCPGGGTYALNPIGTNPSCTRSAAPDNHVLP